MPRYDVMYKSTADTYEWELDVCADSKDEAMNIVRHTANDVGEIMEAIEQ